MTIEIVPVSLPGEPLTDRVYRVVASGRLWRVRLKIERYDSEVRAAMNGPERPVYHGMSFQMSPALLDENGDVARDPSGALIIMETEGFGIPLVTLQQPGFNPDSIADKAIREMLARAEQWCDNIIAANAFAVRWESGAPAGPEVVNGD